MKFDEVGLGAELESYLKAKGFSTLYPPQEAAVRAGLLEGKNLVISSPTASGKTLIAMMAAYLKIKKNQSKVVYLAPLRALASEKYSEFSELGRFGIRCGISTGDFDSSGESLRGYDLLVLTNEKFDSILRHGVSWLNSVGLFVADEVHLAGSDDRGPTLEMILTKIIHFGIDAQILSLSATISNSSEIASWLKSDLVEIDWRPVPLKEGVYDYGRVLFSDGLERSLEQSSYGPAIDTALNSVKEGGQSLIFAGTRRRSVSLATKAGEVTSRFLDVEEKRRCEEAASKIRSAGEETGLSKLLADLVSRGSAFHHAGLTYEHRKIVEEYYRMRAIKLLASTPTLAAGVNLPARRVVVADITRYDNDSGANAAISVLEYRQMAGRAGRPQYDEYGETVIVPPSNYRASEVLDHYVRGEPEPITSRLGGESAMRTHLLATVATGLGVSRLDIDALFSKTLLASQVGKERVGEHLEEGIDYLLREGLIVTRAGLLDATQFGKRVSTLYIDPVTGVLFRKTLEKVKSEGNHGVGYLHLIAGCPDFEPKFPLREKYYEEAYKFLEEHRAELIAKPDSRSFLEYDEILQDMRTVMVIDAWMNEWREDTVLERLGVEPGDLHRSIDISDWLLYCLEELSKLFRRRELIGEIEFLRKRVVNGVKEELVELTRLQGIGRVRARSLYSSGIKTIREVREATVDRLSQIEKIGPATARKIKEQTA